MEHHDPGLHRYEGLIPSQQPQRDGAISQASGPIASTTSTGPELDRNLGATMLAETVVRMSAGQTGVMVVTLILSPVFCVWAGAHFSTEQARESKREDERVKRAALATGLIKEQRVACYWLQQIARSPAWFRPNTVRHFGPELALHHLAGNHLELFDGPTSVAVATFAGIVANVREIMSESRTLAGDDPALTSRLQQQARQSAMAALAASKDAVTLLQLAGGQIIRTSHVVPDPDAVDAHLERLGYKVLARHPVDGF